MDHHLIDQTARGDEVNGTRRRVKSSIDAVDWTVALALTLTFAGFT
jgi:hypothetical protein